MSITGILWVDVLVVTFAGFRIAVLVASLADA